MRKGGFSTNDVRQSFSYTTGKKHMNRTQQSSMLLSATELTNQEVEGMLTSTHCRIFHPMQEPNLKIRSL